METYTDLDAPCTTNNLSTSFDKKDLSHLAVANSTLNRSRDDSVDSKLGGKMNPRSSM